MTTILANAMIYDGAGKKPFSGSIVISGAKIKSVIPGPLKENHDAEIIDVSGMSAAPGFIDVHAHSDLTLFAAPDAYSKISQGITSEISGNCGYSLFPVSDLNRNKLVKDCSPYNIDLSWTSFEEYRNALQSRKPSINTGFLCGESTLRGAVCGYDNTQATPDQIQTQCGLLERELAAGALGLSTGLLYVPGKFASKDELLSILKVAAEHKKIYATHLRSEGKALIEALTEAIELAERSGCQLQISHFKTAGRVNHHKLNEALHMIHEAQARGVSVFADRYPYTFSQTSLSVILPEPFDDMTDQVIQDALSDDPGLCADLLLKLMKYDPARWNEVLLTKTRLNEYSGCTGLSIAEISQMKNIPEPDLILDIMKRDAATAMGAFGGMSKDNLTNILAQNWVCCGTDESARPASGTLSTGHPRGFGSFPRFISMLDTAEAVRRCTALPAEIFHLKDRGRLAAGYYADIVLFNELRDQADFRNPAAPAKGIHAVYVNGVRSFFDGKVTASAGMNL